MSKTAYNAACACSLRHPAKALLKEMGWFADDTGQNIWPSIKTLAERTGLCRRSVQKILRALEQAGAIHALGSRHGGRQKTTRYSIDLAWIERSSERAQVIRGFGREKGERQNPERANGVPEKGAPGSPEQYLTVLKNTPP